jgi:hypothetical protein
MLTKDEARRIGQRGEVAGAVGQELPGTFFPVSNQKQQSRRGVSATALLSSSDVPL